MIAAIRTRALQAAEKLNTERGGGSQAAEKLNTEGVGGFNPRIKPAKSASALAADESFSPFLSEFNPRAEKHPVGV